MWFEIRQGRGGRYRWFLMSNDSEGESQTDGLAPVHGWATPGEAARAAYRIAQNFRDGSYKGIFTEAGETWHF